MAKVRSWIATENEEELVAPVDPAVGEVPSETVEAALVEVEAQDRELEQLVTDGEELSGDIDKMEELAEVAEDSMEEGGMDESSAKVAEVAAESYTAKWGVKVQKIGCENFGVDSRLDNTRIAVEAYDVAVEGMIDTFVTWAKRVAEAAASAWNGIASLSGRIKKRVAKFQSRMENVGDHGKVAIEGKFVRGLMIGGKADVAAVTKSVAGFGQGMMQSGKELAALYGSNGKLKSVIRDSGEAGRGDVGGKAERKASAIDYVAALLVPVPYVLFRVATSTGSKAGIPNSATEVKAVDVGGFTVATYVDKDKLHVTSWQYEGNIAKTVEINGKAGVASMISALSDFAAKAEGGVKANVKALSEAANIADEINKLKDMRREAKSSGDKAAAKEHGTAIKTAKVALTFANQMVSIQTRVITGQVSTLCSTIEAALKVMAKA